MSDVEIARQIERFAADADKRERAAAERHKELVRAVNDGFTAIVKEIHEGFVLLTHTMLDLSRERR